MRAPSVKGLNKKFLKNYEPTIQITLPRDEFFDLPVWGRDLSQLPGHVEATVNNIKAIMKLGVKTRLRDL